METPLALSNLASLLLVGGLAIVPLCCTVAWLLLRARRLAARHGVQLEKLHDEIWELREQAAARERAEAASEAKSRFLATVSHEFRTPLNGILGMADLLRETAPDAEQSSYIDAIKTSGTALATLIEEILDFSKIEAGRLELARDNFDLAELVEGVVELIAPRAHAKGLDIAARVEPDVPRLLCGDAQRLRQVLINLLGNAVKFTAAGGAGLRVSLQADGLLHFGIADTGPGVPLSRRAAIFEEFEQAGAPGLPRHGGSGLGLAISQRIIQKMGGVIALDCPEQGGSVFHFSIVLDATPFSIAPDNLASSTLMALRDASALVVANSPFEAPALAALLADIGAASSVLRDRDSALAALALKPAPRVVVVDSALGEDAALEIARAARAAGCAVSLVLFSPFERRALGRATVEAFDGWLVKPVRPRSLRARLDGRPAAARHAVSPAAPASGRGLNVLLAEDNDINALIASRMLGKLGARVTRVGDGRAAVAAAELAMSGGGERYDLILMDIRMPELDGLAATLAIRAAEAGAGAPRCRIVALTANAFEEDRRAALAAGFDAFMTKPVDVADIAALLRDHRIAA